MRFIDTLISLEKDLLLIEFEAFYPYNYPQISYDTYKFNVYVPSTENKFKSKIKIVTFEVVANQYLSALEALKTSLDSNYGNIDYMFRLISTECKRGEHHI